MKKVLIGILALIMVLGLAGCSSKQTEATNTAEPTETASELHLVEEVSASFSEASFGSSVTKYEYDNNSLILSTSENFNDLTTTVYEYSDNNILVKSITTYKKHDGFSSTTVKEYNDFGDVIKSSFNNSSGLDNTATWEYTYNEDRKPLTYKEVVFADGKEIRNYTISYTYSQNQTIEEIVEGDVTTISIIEFDSNGNKIRCTTHKKDKATQIEATEIEYEYSNTYDEKGNLIKRKDVRETAYGSHLDYEWEYNDNNLVTAEKVYLGEKLMYYKRYIYG